MSDKADVHSQLLALISSCIDEGDYDPAEDYIKDPFCRRTMHTASLAINEIDTLHARVDELEADRDRWKAECEAWRNQAGVWLIVDGKKHWYVQDGNTLFEITEAAATDAAEEVRSE